ncbi:MAG: transcription elongation factor GreA [Ruminococcaceae bacterium]|nr:transcription elongation factor GreA [Oscillospiraceae bacterium]
MTENKEIILTVDGMKSLKDELEYLKTIKRKEVSEKIKQALSFGDLSENSEYDEARNEQAEVESRINQIENMLKFARVLDETEIASDEISLGTKVTLWDQEFEEEVTYSIVGTTEADPENNKLSQESPVGSALLHHKVGDIVEVSTPGGIIEFKVLAISR